MSNALLLLLLIFYIYVMFLSTMHLSWHVTKFFSLLFSFFFTTLHPPTHTCVALIHPRPHHHLRPRPSV